MSTELLRNSRNGDADGSWYVKSIFNFDRDMNVSGSNEAEQ